eukprot:jgi/Tetstr1/427018/TSEL_017223.t1
MMPMQAAYGSGSAGFPAGAAGVMGQQPYGGGGLPPFMPHMAQQQMGYPPSAFQMGGSMGGMGMYGGGGQALPGFGMYQPQPMGMMQNAQMMPQAPVMMPQQQQQQQQPGIGYGNQEQAQQGMYMAQHQQYHHHQQQQQQHQRHNQ